MNTFVESDWRVCRVCLKISEVKMQEIFSAEADALDSLATKIMNCGGIPVLS